MKLIHFSVVLLIFIGFSAQSQNIYEFFCASYIGGRELRDVTFTLSGDSGLNESFTSKTGEFQFSIKQGDGALMLSAAKEGYMTKSVRISPSNYPFENEYELQDIDFVFAKKENGENEQIGELKWNTMEHEFRIAKIDADVEKLKENFAGSNEKLDQIYIYAIECGNEYWDEGEKEMALRNYEIALMAKPEDEYASGKKEEILNSNEEEEKQTVVIDKSVLDQINSGSYVPPEGQEMAEGVLFSVQLGAFSKKVDEQKFADVKDFMMIEYDDYTRCFTGEFESVQDAIERKKEMVSAGYKDAWIVMMQGHERIGF